MMMKKFLSYFLVSCTIMASEQGSDGQGIPETLATTTSTIQVSEDTSKMPLINKAESSSVFSNLPKETLVHIIQSDQRNICTLILVCKGWKEAILEDQKMERAIIETWQNPVSSFTLDETKKGFYRFMNYFPSIMHHNGTLFSHALRAGMGRFLEDNQKQTANWKGQLKAIGLPVMDQPLVFQNQPTFCSLKQIFIAHQNLSHFLFLIRHQNVGNLVLEIASLAVNGMSQKNMNHAEQMLSLFSITPEPEERSFLKTAGSIYKGWRSLQPDPQSLVESDNKTSFGRFLLSPEISYNRTMYAENKELLPSQLNQLAQNLLDYVTRAEKAQNDLLISLIQ